MPAAFIGLSILAGQLSHVFEMVVLEVRQLLTTDELALAAAVTATAAAVAVDNNAALKHLKVAFVHVSVVECLDASSGTLVTVKRKGHQPPEPRTISFFHSPSYLNCPATISWPDHGVHHQLLTRLLEGTAHLCPVVCRRPTLPCTSRCRPRSCTCRYRSAA